MSERIPKKYCIFLQYKDNPKNQAILDWYSTYKEAKEAAKNHPKNVNYTIEIGTMQ